jgi:DNA-binding NarL/FixJ family response regulator
MALRLLIVDDNARFLMAARDLLEREGISVIAMASTGAEAIRRVGELRPDVTLVDVDLGEESGFDVARQLTHASGGDTARVILISAYPEEDFIELIEACPALGFLSKSHLSAAAIRDLLAGADRAGTDQV